MPAPSSATSSVTWSRVVAGDHRDVPARRRVLRRVGEQVRDHLREPFAVRVDDEPGARHRDRELVLSLFDERAGHLDRVGDDRGDLDGRALEAQLAAHGARHVEQVVDQAREVPDLPLDDGALALQRCPRRAGASGGAR